MLLYGSYALIRPPLPDGPGTMHAEIAREMVTRNDWTTPYANGIAIRSSSRPLDWSIAASYKLFGVADWSARLPIALCVLAIAVLVFFFARTIFLWNAAGLYAALLVLVWPGTFLATRNLTSVPVICLETTILAYLLWHFLIVKRLTGVYAIAISAAASALMLLTGGWDAMLPPLVVAAACWIARRSKTAKDSDWVLLAWAGAECILAGQFAPSKDALGWLGPVPPLALYFGGRIANSEAFSGKERVRQVAIAIFCLAILVGAIAIFFAIHGPLSFQFIKISVLLTASASRIPLLILTAALLAGATGNLLFRLRDKARIANCFLAGMLGGVTVAVQAALVLASPFVSSQILADAIRPELDPSDIVVIDGKYPDASSFAFYLERPILIAVPAGVNPPSLASSLPVGVVAVDQAWAGTARVYLWTRTGHTWPVSGQSYIVASSGGKEIFSNQPNTGGAAF